MRRLIVNRLDITAFTIRESVSGSEQAGQSAEREVLPVNNFGAFARWSYLEISGEDSLYDAPNLIRAHYTTNPFAHWFPDPPTWDGKWMEK